MEAQLLTAEQSTDPERGKGFQWALWYKLK